MFEALKLNQLTEPQISVEVISRVTAAKQKKTSNAVTQALECNQT
jgi:hypothetical protein